MRIAPFFVAGVAALGIGCGHPPNTDLFMPTTTGSGGATVAGTGGDSSTGGATSGSGSGSATTSTATGGAAGTENGSGGASVTAGAGGAGGDPTTTGGGGSDPGGGAGSDDAGAGGGPPDAGPADADAASGAPRRILCGDTTCTALEQYCCIRNERQARCEPLVGGDCPASGDRVYCDDRSDCALATQICCAADLPSTNSLADCRLPGACNGPKAQRLCDPQVASSCGGVGMSGACRADTQSTIDGYAYCH